MLCIFSLRKDLRFRIAALRIYAFNLIETIPFLGNAVGITKPQLPVYTYTVSSCVSYRGRCKTMGQILFMKYNRCRHTLPDTALRGLVTSTISRSLSPTARAGFGSCRSIKASLCQTEKKTIVNCAVFLVARFFVLRASFVVHPKLRTETNRSRSERRLSEVRVEIERENVSVYVKNKIALHKII